MDSVQYLRQLGSGLVGTISSHHAPAMNEIADEIQQLREENERLKDSLARIALILAPPEDSRGNLGELYEIAAKALREGD